MPKNKKHNTEQKIDKSTLLSYEGEIDNYIFDDDKLTKNLHSACGFFKEQFYFGKLIPKKITKKVKINNNSFEKQIQIFVPMIILDDHTWFEVNENFEEKYNVKFSDFNSNNEWALSEIERWITFQGAMADHFKVLEPKEMFEKVRTIYKKYCFFQDEEWYDINALWDIGTYFIDMFKAYPYKEEQGLKGTGKTKTMSVSRLIAFNSTPIFTNPTPSTIFRLVESNKPSFYFDECEKLISSYKKGGKEVDDVVQFLNSGWEKGGFVPRVEKNEQGKFEVKNFSTYCPKRLGSIRGLEELPATADRCITQIHIKSPKEDKRGDLWIENNQEFYDVRNALYPFALKYWQDVYNRYVVGSVMELKKIFNLSNRDWLLWKPFLCIAQMIDNKTGAEGEFFKKIGKYAEKLTDIKTASSVEEGSYDFKILNSLWSIVELSKSNEEIEVKISGIRNNIEITEEKEKRPSPQYIGWFINKIGFKKFRKRTGSKGVFFLLRKKDVEFILKTQNLFTLITPLHQEEEVIEDK